MTTTIVEPISVILYEENIAQFVRFQITSLFGVVQHIFEWENHPFFSYVLDHAKYFELRFFLTWGEEGAAYL